MRKIERSQTKAQTFVQKNRKWREKESLIKEKEATIKIRVKIK